MFRKAAEYQEKTQETCQFLLRKCFKLEQTKHEKICGSVYSETKYDLLDFGFLAF